MSNQELHLQIMERLGGVAADIKGIHMELQRINGRITANAELGQQNRTDLSNMKGKASALGAIAGIIVSMIIQFLSKLI